ncbi:MAG: substrate-binding domain-containing protein [Porcipelethomonas sp.]
MQKRPLIGIVTSLLARNHIRNIVSGAIAQARTCGCDVIVLAPLVHFTYSTPEHALAEREIYQLIASEDIDGFLYVKDETTMGNEVITQIEQLLMHSNKFIMTVDEQVHPLFDSTQYDDYDDFGKVVEHLIEVHGCRKIYCLTGPENSFQAQTRLRAWQDIMEQHGLHYDENYYSYGTFWVDSAIAFADRLISGELSMPDAVVCGNDVMAMALIKSLQAEGIRVPDDVAVTGYDNFPFAANVDVMLTTYARNHFQLGADAARRLYRNMTGLLCSKVHHPESGILIGNSCGCNSIPAKQILSDSSAAIPRMWEEKVFGDSMVFDLAQAKTVPDLLQRALFHSSILYQMQSVRIYLYESAGQCRLAASCLADGVPQTYSGKTLQNTAASFLQSSDQSEVLFLSPLHLNERQFGMISLSYGEHDRVYDRSYLHFVSDLEIALDRLPDHRTDAISVQTESASIRNRAVMRAKLDRLRSNLRDAPNLPWTIEMLCFESGIPKSTLQKYYKQFFGKSVFEELIIFRVEMAKQLLTETDLTLREIAVRCGYSTESYFIKQFKNVTHVTPTAYRHSIIDIK